MKKQTMEILHRYRKHLLEREQAVIQDKIAEENNQKARVLQLRSRVRETHDAKLRATVARDVCLLDEAAAYLHGRVTLAQRALALAGVAREEAMERTLQLKKERDQIGLILEKNQRRLFREQDESERLLLDDLATARHAFAGREA